MLHSLKNSWNRLRESARREFLRDPDVLLFERVPDPAAPVREGVGGR